MNLKKVGLIAAAAIGIPVVLVLAIAATKPDEFRIQRSAVIKATPQQVYEQIEDYHNWTKWSPYENKDPNMKRTYSGVPTGKGAIYEWRGNDEIGQGRMEIFEVQPPSKISINLDFVKPMPGHNVVVFTMEPQTEGTKVTWSMTGESPFMCKVMQVFMNMDEMCGKDFEVGLANMKKVLEKSPDLESKPAESTVK